MACVATGLVAAPGEILFAQDLHDEGCPKAHCDQANSGFINLPVPGAGVDTAEIIWDRRVLVGEQAGSNIGLGCSANGVTAVCSYDGFSAQGPDDNIIAYDYDGVQVLWSSLDKINRSTYASAPMILGDGAEAHTIAVDGFRAIRFDHDGDEVWNTPYDGDDGETYGGTPISPVITDSGVIVLATTNGPPGFRRGKIYAIDSETGLMLAAIHITEGGNDEGAFETHKSAAVDGNRVYLSMQHRPEPEESVADDVAWFVALDVDAEAQDPEEVLTVAWHYEFSTGAAVGGVGSKSSPLLMYVGANGKPVLFFDGYYYNQQTEGPEDAVPQIFAIQDDGGNNYTVLWQEQPLTPTFAAFLADPRSTPEPSFWHLLEGNKFIRRRAVDDGQVFQSIDIDQIIGNADAQVCSSAMTMAGTASDPFIIISARDEVMGGDSFVVAIRLSTSPPSRWFAVNVGDDNVPAGQFALLKNGTDTRVIFSAFGPSVKAIGEPD